MPFVSVTRFRLRSVRFMPSFVRHTLRTVGQVRLSEGFIQGSLLADRRLAFWTMTAWRDQKDMRGYMTGGSHLEAMPLLMDWCDEASLVHWQRSGDGAPSWRDCDTRMRTEGRPSKLLHPSAAHANLAFRLPRLWSTLDIRPSARRR